MECKTCANCKYAYLDPSWSLRGLWCTQGVDLAKIDRSVDWGFDYVAFRIECTETEPNGSCEEFVPCKPPVTVDDLFDEGLFDEV